MESGAKAEFLLLGRGGGVLGFVPILIHHVPKETP
jgi:hypothetical protein